MGAEMAAEEKVSDGILDGVWQSQEDTEGMEEV